MPSNNGSPLAVKLLRQTLAVLWVIIITLLAVDILVDYKTHRSDVNINQAKQLSLLTPALTKALETGQIDITRQLIKEFLVNSSIHSATIAYADGKQLLQATKDAQASWLSDMQTETHSIETTQGLQYSLQLTLDRNALNDNFMRRSIAMVTLTILAMVLISIILYVLFEQQITKPLRAMVREMTRREAGPIDAIKQPAKASSEMKQWVNHTNQLLESVRKVRSQQSVAKAEASRLRRFDELTDLPNRSYFLQELNKRIHLATNHDQQPALLLFGLDGFANINSKYGTAIGDKLLVAVTQRMSKHRGEGQFIARINGDQFAMLCEHMEQNYEAGQLAQSMLHTIARPFSVSDKRLEVSASVGIALFPQDAKTADQFLENADKAMMQAKKQGRNQYQYYLASTDAKMRRRKALEDALRNAPKAGELSLLYQPKFNIQENSVCGAEALIRWTHPEFGMVSPDEFIPIAESSNLIIPIGAWVIQHACEQLAVWHKMGHDNFQVAVNLSAVQLRQPSMLSTIESAIRSNGIPPSSLVIEITETAIIDDIDRSIEVLNDMHTLGVSIAMDDFGTGYSSLNYLKRLPLHQIKIDKSFIDDVGKYAKDDMIIQSIIQLAHNLKLKVVAEGVETFSQHEFLSDLDCQEGQGYFYSPPLKAKEFKELIFDNQFIQTDNPLAESTLLH
ncbi:MAG: EAL domain-containing protein [Gammaproteobacteria bacterium]